jgi:hypothetical protein
MRAVSMAETRADLLVAWKVPYLAVLMAGLLVAWMVVVKDGKMAALWVD